MLPPSADAVAQVTSLENGAPVLFHHLKGAPRLTLSFYLPGGNSLDNLAGQNDIIDRLLTKGTASKDAEAVAIAIDRLSLDLDVSTGRDYTVLSVTMLPEDLSPALALVKELLFESNLAELDKELDRLEGELAMDLDSPRSRASDLLLRNMFGGTGYGVSTSVMQEALPALQAAKPAFMERYKQLYTADRLIIAGSGELPLQHLLDALESSLGALPKGQAAASIEASLAKQAAMLNALTLAENKRVGYAWPDASQSHLFQAWAAPNVTHADYTPFLVLNTVLGAAGLSSRLFTELRDKQGLAYHVRSSLEGYKHCGLFSLYIGTDPSNTAKCIAGFKIEIDKLLNVPVGAAELDATKRNMLGRRAVFLETSSQWTAYIGNNFLLGRSPQELDLIESQIKAVTSEDIQRVAQAYLSKPFITSLSGPQAQVDALLGGTL